MVSDPSDAVDKIIIAADVALWGVGVWLITIAFPSRTLNRAVRNRRVLLRAVAVIIVALSLFDTFVPWDLPGLALSFWTWCIFLGTGMIPLALCSIAFLLYIRALAQKSLQVLHARLVFGLLCLSCVAWVVSFAIVPVWAGTLSADMVFGSLHKELSVKLMTVLFDTGNVISKLATFIASISLWRFMTLNIRRAKLLHSQAIATPVSQVDQGAMSS